MQKYWEVGPNERGLGHEDRENQLMLLPREWVHYKREQFNLPSLSLSLSFPLLPFCHVMTQQEGPLKMLVP